MRAKWIFLLVAVVGLNSYGAGFSRVEALHESGTNTVAYSSNNIWRPTAVALSFATSASRTITIYRYNVGITYTITAVTQSGSSFVYVLPGNFWFSGLDSLRIVVSPYSAGTLEVIGE